MGFLDKYFSVKRELEKGIVNEEEAQGAWNNYLLSKEKKDLLLASSLEDSKLLDELKFATSQELVALSTAGVLEDKVFELVQKIARETRLRQIYLKEVSYYANSLPRFMNEMLLELRLALKIELGIIASSDSSEIRRKKFNDEYLIECDILKKITQVGNYQKGIIGLLTGKLKIDHLSAKEEQAAKLIPARMKRILKNEDTPGITGDWVRGIYEVLRNNQELLNWMTPDEAGNIPEFHPAFDYQFVNSEE